MTDTTIHLPMGGSTVTRTINCPAWIQRSKKTKQKPAGNAANLGNLLHDAMENYYAKEESFDSQIERGLKYEDLVLTEEHLPILGKMVTATEKVLTEYDIDLILCEPFVELIPDFAGGSIDMLGVSSDGKTAITLDYKTGRGVVRAEENNQLLFYTLCAKADSKTRDMLKYVTNYVGAIVQPLIYGDTADVYEFDSKQLKAFSDLIADTIVEVQAKKPKAKAGPHCLFCPRSPFCEEKRAQARTAYLLPIKDQIALSDAVALAQDLQAWCKETLESALYFANEGINIEGYKRVHGRSVRAWADVNSAYDTLISLGYSDDELQNRQFISVTQAEKLLGKKVFSGYDNLVTKPEGKPTLVPESDPREEINTNNLNTNLNKFLQKNL